MNRIKPEVYRPASPVAPGAIISELMVENETSLFDMAQDLDLDDDQAYALLRGDLPVTEEIAESLSIAFDIPQSVWINLETRYREDLQLKREREEEAGNLAFTKLFPIQAMIDLKWIEIGKTRLETARNVLRFFDVVSWIDFSATSVFRAAFRKSPSRSANHYSLAAWLRRGELLAASQPTDVFDPAGLKGRLEELRSLTLSSAEVFVPRIRSICAEHGVAVVLVPEIRGCFASGAAYRSKNRHVIQLSFRYKTIDHFWFSFFHELGHVLLHYDQGTFVDGFSPDRDIQETEANDFASETLIPKVAYSQFVHRRRITRSNIMEFGDSIGIAPGIVVGRLQKDRIISHDMFYDLKVTLDNLDKLAS